MGVDVGLYMYDVVVKSSRSLSHLLTSCLPRLRQNPIGMVPSSLVLFSAFIVDEITAFCLSIC